MSESQAPTGVQRGTGSRDAEPSRAHVPLMDCRIYVANFLDLFEDLIGRIYEAGKVDGPVIIHPAATVGETLSLTEQKLANALIAPGGADGRTESVLLSLLRNLVAGDDADLGDLVVGQVIPLLANDTLPTFAEKADSLELFLAALTRGNSPVLNQEQVDQAMTVFRSVGQTLADLIAIRFPVISRERTGNAVRGASAVLKVGVFPGLSGGCRSNRSRRFRPVVGIVMTS